MRPGAFPDVLLAAAAGATIPLAVILFAPVPEAEAARYVIRGAALAGAVAVGWGVLRWRRRRAPNPA